MLGPSLTYLLLATLVVSGWYLLFRSLNRRQAMLIVQWIETALGGHGHVLGLRWLTPSRFRIPVRMGGGFHQASVFVQLVPRELPMSWFWSRLRRQHDIFTFEADLECPPRFNLQVANHRWCGRTRRKIDHNLENWIFDQSGPFVITTRSDWQRDITTMLSALVASRDQDLLGVSFRRSSPHFSATVRLDSIVPHGGARSHLFDTLRELAAEANTARF